MPVSRQPDVGLAGRKPGAEDGAQRSAGTLSDPYIRQYVVELPLVASGAEQLLPVPDVLPARCQSMSGFLRVKTASTGGAAQTISLGTVGVPASLLAATSIAVADDFNTIQDVNLNGGQLTYTLGGADITGFEGELVLTVLASDD